MADGQTSINILESILIKWINNHTHYKVCDEITYPFPNFNGAMDK